MTYSPAGWTPWTGDGPWGGALHIDGTNLVQLTDGPPMPSGGRPEETLTGKMDSRIEDFDPCWLPNGRIVFMSERRGGFGRCHDLNVKPSYTLYSMKDDGSDLYCIDTPSNPLLKKAISYQFDIVQTGTSTGGNIPCI